MAVKLISLTSVYNVKYYTSLTTDLRSAYPVDNADGSIMTIMNPVSGKTSGYCIKKNGTWTPSNVKIDVQDGVIFYPAINLGEDLTIDFEERNVRNVIIDTPFDIAQVESATLIGTITTAGDVTVTITSAIVVGSPLAISVAVALDDEPTDVAEKIRLALVEEFLVSKHYAIGRVGAVISLTALVIVADDSTLNIAIADDTAVGVTAVVTSVDTVEGGINDKTIGLLNVPNQCKLNLQITETNGSVITWFSGITWLVSELVPATGTLYNVRLVTFDGGTSWIEQT